MVIYSQRISIVADHVKLVMGEVCDRQGKRHAARLGEESSPPPGEVGGAQSVPQEAIPSNCEISCNAAGFYAGGAAKDHT